jgi:hypothetical protein
MTPGSRQRPPRLALLDCCLGVGGKRASRPSGGRRPRGNLDELKRCFDLGLRCGVKMHRYHQPEYHITDAFLTPVCGFLNERRLIYINHHLGTDAQIAELAQRFPEMAILNGHGGIQHARLGSQHPMSTPVSAPW